jgi:hypothetical protein
MLMWRKPNSTANLGEPTISRDCRVKPAMTRRGS